MLTRRALVAGLASCLATSAAACARPAAAPTSTPTAIPPTPIPTTTRPTATVVSTETPAATATSLAAATPAATPTTAPQATPAPSNQVALDIRLFNGAGEVQLDGRTVDPGHFLVDRGPHQAAALVDGQVVAIADAPPNGGNVDLVVPAPLASLAVMIENQADARPQTGLTQADVVYEALAEGGITRFIALYLSGDASPVGPVRSLRHYFAFMAAEYGADVVHIGASPEGYAWRDALHMGHLDETYGDPGVWRVGTRPPPHNAYTGTAADRGFLQQRGAQQNHSWGPLLFSDAALVGQLPAQNISLSFRPWAYRVDYAWDAAQGRYLRKMEGAPHRDAASGEQIAPASVVVQFVEVDPVRNDPKYRLDMNLAGGGGQLVVFSGGTRRDGTWSKADPRSATIWLDAGGSSIVLPLGQVWVEILPLDSPLNVS